MIAKNDDIDRVACGVGELADKNFRPLFFGGHCFYCRKCVQGEQVGDDFWERHLDGIVLPESVADFSQTVEVLAKGPKVGQPCSKAHMELFKRAKCLEDQVEVGDLLLCPEEHHGIKRSELNWDSESFIEESVPLAIWKNTGGEKEA